MRIRYATIERVTLETSRDGYDEALRWLKQNRYRMTRAEHKTDRTKLPGREAYTVEVVGEKEIQRSCT